MTEHKYSASQAAAELKTDARTLRRFLRKDPTYNNAGAGGRYEFTTRELATLKKRFDAWHSLAMTHRSGRKVDTDWDVEDPEDYAAEIIVPKVTPELLRQARKQEEELMRRVSECGLTTSVRAQRQFADMQEQGA